MNCFFWNFPFNNFRPWLAIQRETTDRGNSMFTNPIIRQVYLENLPWKQEQPMDTHLAKDLKGEKWNVILRQHSTDYGCWVWFVGSELYSTSWEAHTHNLFDIITCVTLWWKASLYRTRKLFGGWDSTVISRARLSCYFLLVVLSLYVNLSWHPTS